MTHCNFPRLFIVFAAIAVCAFKMNAQAVYQYGFENLPGNNATTASPWTGTPDVLVTGLSNSSWSTNYSGGFVSYGGSCGNSTCQALSISHNNSPATTLYTLSFTVDSGYALNITGLSFWNQASGTGPTKVNIAIKGIAAVSNLAIVTGNTGLLTPATAFNNLTGAVVVSLTLSGASSANGTFRLDDFVIDGTVTSSSPSIYNVTGGGAFCAGAGGVPIGLNGSLTTSSYQLKNGTNNVGNPIAGTGSAINFGNISAAGTYTVVGTDTTTLATTNQNGNAVVTVNPVPVVNSLLPVSTCANSDTLDAGNPGAKFLWSNGDSTQTIVVTTTGNYAVTVTDINSCTATAVDTVTFGATLVVSATPTQNPICSGTSTDITASGGTTYLWNNSNTTATINVAPLNGTLYSVTATNGTGCTGTASVNITILSVSSTTLTQNICNGQSYNGHTASGTYTDTLGSANGCDSIVYLTLNVGSGIATQVSQTVCAGQAYNGHTVGGVYNDTLLSSSGCDSVVTLNLTVLNQITSSSFQTICAGQSYNGHSATGVYTDTLQSASNCDSIVTTQLLVTAALTSSITQTICAGQNYNGHSASGSYTDTLLTAGGCDSIVTLQLTVNNPITSSLSQTICAGQTYGGHGATGIFTDTLLSGSGCDSIRTVNLTVTAALASSTTQTVCSGQGYNGHYATGTYNDTLTTGSGCDSVVTLNLTVLSAASNSITYSICKGDTFMGHTATGSYSDTLTSGSGCDSVVSLQLTVNALPHVTLYLAFDTVCSNAAAITMSGGSPAGGSYSGQAISGGQFVPSIANPGIDTIYYTFTDSNGCTKSRYEFAHTEICTGIDPTVIANFTISPNPTQGYITIESANLNETYALEMFDLPGRKIEAIEGGFSGRKIVDMNSLPSGIYLLSIKQNGNIVRTEKIVKL